MVTAAQECTVYIKNIIKGERKMKRTKKMAALVLAASMVMSSSMVAFAEDPVTSGTGTTSGAGAVEGHVNKEVLNVDLPTVPAGTSAFAYTMDPERLIQGTDAAKYAEGTTFPDKNSDTGVYFLTGDNTYANTSNTYQVVNKSSAAIALTVEVQATQNTAKDITLGSSTTPAGTTPELYLGLKVGNDVKPVSTTKATFTKTIAGTPGNFEVTVATAEDGTTKSYVYKEKADATSWKAMNISMTGSVNNVDIEADTTAPTVDVTWSWAKAADNATADTDAVDYTGVPATSSVPSTVAIPASGDITVTVTTGVDEAELTSLVTTAFAGNMLTMTNSYGAVYADNIITLKSGIATALRGMSENELAATKFTATFGSGEDAYTQEFTFTK